LLFAAGVFTVTQLTDQGANQVPVVQGSLTWAIEHANNWAAPNKRANPTRAPGTINFSLSYDPSKETPTIVVTGGLPIITQNVIINGYSQGGQGASQGVPYVELQGSAGSGSGFDGLVVKSGGVVIEGLAIDSFKGNGIWLNDKGATQGKGDTVQGCYIGTNLTGTQNGLGNSSDGLLISGSNNTIGGVGSVGNVISGNAVDGIVLAQSAAVSNVVQSNYIGVNKNGNAALPNASDGVTITAGAQNNTIGAANSLNLGNIISGNSVDGVHISSSQNNYVYGNSIGLDVKGNALGNSMNGVVLDGNASSNNIGSSDGKNANYISGNGGEGVLLDAPETVGANDQNNVSGNMIGVASDGLTRVANGGSGIEIDNVVGTTIANNVISGNIGDGLDIYGDLVKGIVLGVYPVNPIRL
jgi:hypothetical protein